MEVKILFMHMRKKKIINNKKKSCVKVNWHVFCPQKLEI